MRTLTVNEIDAVSGGEGACFATNCGPMPSVSAGGVANAASTASAASTAAALSSKNPRTATMYVIAAAACDAVAAVAGWFAD